MSTDALEIDTLVGAAVSATGLDDFGDDDWREGLARLVVALDEEARLNELGEQIAAGEIVTLLSNRLELIAWRRDHPEIAEADIVPPIVIVGQARTGTTILFDLLAQDPATRVPLTWEVDRPMPPPETATYDTDPRIHEVDELLAGTDLLIPGFRTIHPLGAQLAQECVRITASAFRSVTYPTQYRVPSYARWVLYEADMAPAYRWHRHYLQHLQSRHPAGKQGAARWLVKSPGHIWCLDALLAEYPDAFLVQTHRDPLTIIASVSSLQATLRSLASDDPSVREIAAEWANYILEGLDRSVTAREDGTVAADRVVDVTFSAFMADPFRVSREVYAGLGLELTPATELRMHDFLAAQSRPDAGGTGTPSPTPVSTRASCASGRGATRSTSTSRRRRPEHRRQAPGMVLAMSDRPTRPRIPPLPEAEWDERTRELLGRVGVPGGETVNIFTTLVRHPRLFRHWLPFGGALLTGSLPARDREILILRTAWRCRSGYEWGQHVRLGLGAGLTSDEIERIITGPEGVSPDQGGWSPLEVALLHAADELHEDNCVGDDTWRVLAEHYDERELIELVMVVGQYHLVAGALNSFGVQREPGVTGFPELMGGWRMSGRHMSGRLDRDTILVVGAGTQPTDDPEAPLGNGRAIARRAAQEGAVVVCADRSGAAADETVRQIVNGGGRAVAAVGDVTEEADCAALVAGAAAEGVLTGVVMNAGIGKGGGLTNTTASDWDDTFAVNLRGAFFIARAALPRLGEGGSIVFVGSVAGLKPGSRLPAYDASKAGLIGLCRHVAMEGARSGVRANVVAPGLIDTPLGRLASQGRPSRSRTPVPLGRQGTAWEVAAAVAFLLSDDASYVTGQTLAVDGGLTLL